MIGILLTFPRLDVCAKNKNNLHVQEYEIDNPDILEEWADLFDAHEVLHNVKKEYEDKLAKAQAKQPKAEW